VWGRGGVGEWCFVVDWIGIGGGFGAVVGSVLQVVVCFVPVGDGGGVLLSLLMLLFGSSLGVKV